MNFVALKGNLTRDPELRHTASNTAVVNAGMAVNRRWTDKNGEKQEETTFVELTCWGRTGEVLNQYCQKGRPLLVEGRLSLDQWEDKDGNKRQKLFVTVERLHLLGSGSSEENASPQDDPADAL